MGSKFTWVLILGFTVVFAVVIAMHWERDEPPPVRATPVDSAPAPAAPAAVPSTAPPPSNRPATPPPMPATTHAAPSFVSAHEAQVREATDYLELARQLLPKAREGDADAQFHLYQALDYCRNGYAQYFDRGQKRNTLDEALREASGAPRTDLAEVRRVHARCQKLMADDSDELAHAERWLNAAVAGAHPRAQVEMAAQMASNSLHHPAQRAAQSLSEARRMTRAALASRDAATIWKAGALTPLRQGSTNNDYLEGLAWWQAACSRGLDCGPGSERVRELCRFIANCQAHESVDDILRRSAQNPTELDTRAREINALIDAGDWEALGLADPASP
jgi:hypothetical protein